MGPVPPSGWRQAAVSHHDDVFSGNLGLLGTARIRDLARCLADDFTIWWRRQKSRISSSDGCTFSFMEASPFLPQGLCMGSVVSPRETEDTEKRGRTRIKPFLSACVRSSASLSKASREECFMSRVSISRSPAVLCFRRVLAKPAARRITGWEKVPAPTCQPFLIRGCRLSGRIGAARWIFGWRPRRQADC